MIINEHNYEAFLLDYLEDRLNPQECIALMDFLEAHPALKTDLDVSTSLVLQDAQSVVFARKEMLKKQPGSEMGLSELEYLLIKKHEEGLSLQEDNKLTKQIRETELSEEEWSLFGKVKLLPNIGVKYPNKKDLRKGGILFGLDRIWINRIASVLLMVLLSSVVWILHDRIGQDSKTLLGNSVKNEYSEKQIIAETAITEPKIVEKEILNSVPISPDSIKKMASQPKDQLPQKKKSVVEPVQIKDDKKDVMKLASITELPKIQLSTVNGYEAGLNAMMPQYFSNNLLSKELAGIYKELEETEKAPSMSIALVESSVKVVNIFSRDRLNLNKQYDHNGNLIGYRLTGENIELSRKAK